MNLIAYSDSDESDNDAPQAPKLAAKPAPKPTFQKVVDRSNPGKIKLNLPTPSQPKGSRDDIEAEAPPAKKARTGGGAFGGFNAMLPAPKKPKVDAQTGGAISGKRGLGKGLGAGVNLKTGAEPAFQREPRMEEYDENGDPIKKADATPLQKEDFRAMLNLPPPKTETRAESKQQATSADSSPAVTENKPVAKPRFMPLSVARGKKKKSATPRPVNDASKESKASPASSFPAPVAETKPAARPKVSLFGVSHEEDSLQTKDMSSANYQPLLYGAVEEDDDAQVPDEAFDQAKTLQSNIQSHPTSAVGGPQDLTSIASGLNLSESERRQLFGRKGRGPDFATANIIEFNTDTEYAHNEKLRQQGETVQHNALKSISGTGKNSLKSLINVATTQKDALEDHFAAGKRNKREAGNKYGW